MKADVIITWTTIPSSMDRRRESELSPREQKRVKQIADPEKQNQAFWSRILLRQELSRFTGKPAQSFSFTYSEEGRPELIESDLSFNVAHSGRLWAVALAHGQRVGFDLEELRPRQNMSGILKRFFSEETHSSWTRLAEDDQRQAFFRLWTARESSLKFHAGSVAYLQPKNDVIGLKALQTSTVKIADNEYLSFPDLDKSMICALVSSKSPSRIIISRIPF